MAAFRLLVCGAGSASLHVAQVAAADGRGETVGFFDPVPRALERAQAALPEAVGGDDYEALLKQTRPDVVVVGGPDHLHAAQTLQALEHGCHALVEKPLATTIDDAQRVIDKAEETGLEVMTDHTFRYMHPWRETALAAREGTVGDVFFVQGDYIHDMWSYYSPEGESHTPWRIDLDHPQNILLGGGCHPIDLMLWAVGAPVSEVHAYSSKMSIPEFPSDDCYILSLKFANGVLGKVFVSSGCSGHGMGGGPLAVYGTEGSLWNGRIYRRGARTRQLAERSPGSTVGGHGWGGSVVDFLDVLEGKRENPITARDGAAVVSVCDAAFRSLSSGCPHEPVSFGQEPMQLRMSIGAQTVSALPAASLPATYEIRSIRSKDKGSWAKMMRAAGFAGWTRARIDEWLAAPERRDGSRVVIHEGQVVAATFATRNSPTTGALDYVAAHPDHSGRGLGRAVCLGVLNYLTAKGYTEVTLSTDDFRLAALKVYLDLGFKPVIQRPDMVGRWKRVHRLLAAGRSTP